MSSSCFFARVVGLPPCILNELHELAVVAHVTEIRPGNSVVDGRADDGPRRRWLNLRVGSPGGCDLAGHSGGGKQHVVGFAGSRIVVAAVSILVTAIPIMGESADSSADGALDLRDRHTLPAAAPMLKA